MAPKPQWKSRYSLPSWSQMWLPRPVGHVDRVRLHLLERRHDAERQGPGRPLVQLGRLRACARAAGPSPPGRSPGPGRAADRSPPARRRRRWWSWGHVLSCGGSGCYRLGGVARWLPAWRLRRRTAVVNSPGRVHILPSMPTADTSATDRVARRRSPAGPDARDPVITLEHVVKRFGSYVAVRGGRLRHRAGRVLLAARALGLRQDDDAADDRRASSSRPPGGSCSRARTSRGSRPTGATSTPSSSTTRCSRT